MLKTVNPVDLPAALRTAVAGTVYHAIGASEAVPDEGARAAGLTDREIEILRLVAKGLTTEAIGGKLWVSVPTVKFHLRNVYRKLGVAEPHRGRALGLRERARLHRRRRGRGERLARRHGLSSSRGATRPSLVHGPRFVRGRAPRGMQ